LTISRIGLVLASTIVAATVTGAGMTVASFWFSDPADALSADTQLQVSFPQVNRETKRDRLIAGMAAAQTATYQLVSVAPTEIVEPPQADAVAPAVEPAPAVATAQPVVKPKPVAPKLPSASVLRDAQIANIKERLKLSAAQERHWPAVEVALRGVLRQAYESKRKGDGSIDPNSAEVQRLKSAAMPLLMQMREDQKREVRQLAQVIGLADVAAML
jgi:hypothetical protein